MTVHAVTGMVNAVTPTSLSLAASNGVTSEFTIDPSARVSVTFDSGLRADTAAPAQFNKVGDFVVVYYYGYDTQRTAIAIKDLGAGPFTKAQGTVVAFDKHTRSLTLRNASGKETSLVLEDSLIVDTDTGVSAGRRFSPHKGDQVRVTYTAGTPATVAFLRESL
ncbi:MAG: hypothetical protein V4555_18300 [Acidobacteriota bacterium]